MPEKNEMVKLENGKAWLPISDQASSSYDTDNQMEVENQSGAECRINQQNTGSLPLSKDLQASLDDDVFSGEKDIRRKHPGRRLNRQASIDDDTRMGNSVSFGEVKGLSNDDAERMEVGQTRADRDSVISNQSASSETSDKVFTVRTEKGSYDSGCSVSSFDSQSSISNDIKRRLSHDWRQKPAHFTSQDSQSELSSESQEECAELTSSQSGSSLRKRTRSSIVSHDSISSTVGHLDLDKEEGNEQQL